SVVGPPGTRAWVVRPVTAERQVSGFLEARGEHLRVPSDRPEHRGGPRFGGTDEQEIREVGRGPGGGYRPGRLGDRAHEPAPRARSSTPSRRPCQANPARFASCQTPTRAITFTRIHGSRPLRGLAKYRGSVRCRATSCDILPVRRCLLRLWYRQAPRP